jgi:beta-glucosidase/6-phospho-beta-glucosidase/beta-galactosidase
MDAYRFSISWSRILPSKYKITIYVLYGEYVGNRKDVLYKLDASDQNCYIAGVLISAHANHGFQMGREPQTGKAFITTIS